MTRRLLRNLSLLLVMVLPLPVAAQGERYQAVVIPPTPGSAGDGAEVLILDSQEGHFWIWSGNQVLRDSQNRIRIGNALIYQGQVRPGQQPGEVILAPRP